MSKHNLNILFWLFKAKANKKGEVPLYLRISYDSQRKNLSTGFRILPARWDSSKGKVKGQQGDSSHINKYIAHTKTRMQELFNEMLHASDINLDLLLEKFFGKDVNSRTLLELVEYHNADFKSRIGTDYTESTYEKYDILKRKLEVFIPHRYEKKDIRLRDLSIVFMSDFDFYLKANDNNEHNTATKYLKNLKKIVNLGVRNDWLDENPFEHFKAVYKDVDRVYLTQKELEIIQNKQFRLDRLNNVRDYFLFQCYTGLSYCDMARLTLGDISPLASMEPNG